MRSFATLILFTVVLAAAGPIPAPADPDEDSNAPGPEHAKLEALTGNWDVSVTYPGPSGRQRQGTAEMRAEWVMDGRFLRHTYTSVFAGKPLTIVRYIGFDRQKNRVLEVQFESTRTSLLYNEGAISADGSKIICLGKHANANVRTVTTLNDPKTFTLELKYLDAAGAEVQTVTLLHRRRAAD